MTTFLAVYCFPGSHFSTFNHNSFFNVCLFVCLFVSYCFVSEERGGNQLDGMCNSSYAFYKLPTVLILLIDWRKSKYFSAFLIRFQSQAMQVSEEKKRNDSGAVKNAVSTLYQHEVRYFNVCLALTEIYSFAVFPYYIKVIVNIYI